MSAVRVVYPRIDEALRVVESEIETMDIEAEAFQSFLARLRQLEPTITAGIGDVGAVTAMTDTTGINPGLVRTAYRETVLSMPHYERDYGEPLVENIGFEFGPESRELVATEAPISGIHRGLIEAAAEQAVGDREQFRRALVNERDSLTGVKAHLEDIERDLYDLRRTSDKPTSDDPDREERITALASACGTLAEERQQHLHQRPTPALAGIGDRSLTTFLYGDRDHQFPALVEITDVSSRIESARGR